MISAQCSTPTTGGRSRKVSATPLRSRTHMEQRVAVSGEEREGVLAEQLEALLGALRGEALLIATLAYGLGVRLSQLQSVRVRDVRVAAQSVVVAGRERRVPTAVMEDLRECVQELLCGCDASGRGQQRDRPLFSEHGFSELLKGCELVDRLLTRSSDTDLAERVSHRTDSRLRIVAWLHRKFATRRGVRFDSPLDLLDKGPRIVRRRAGGRVDAYYLWKVSPVLLPR